MIIEMQGVHVSVHFAPGMTNEQAAVYMASSKFTQWAAALNKLPRQEARVNSISFQHVAMFGPNPGFIKCKADIILRGGKPGSGEILLRGGAAAVLVVINLTDSADKRLRTVTVTQPRFPIGELHYEEIVAGMVDANEDFKSAALRELLEELGIKAINIKDFIGLSDLYTRNGNGAFSSPGLLDEQIKYYAWQVSMTTAQFNEFEGKITVDLAGTEVIALKTGFLEDLIHSDDSKALCALLLYKHHCGVMDRRSVTGVLG